MAFVYSCCFWFSLRLGGIMIGLFTLALFFLAACCVAHSHIQDVHDTITQWTTTMNLIYTKEYLENVAADPDKYITLCICFACFKIILCVLYIYGAYTFNNLLMFGFILSELLRLAIILVVVATWLFVLKQNTMDIGLLIGASVAGGFFLLGMFYLWVCAANLPVLINEMERDEQAATINKLQQLLQTNPRTNTHSYDNISLVRESPDLYHRGILIAPTIKGSSVNDKTLIFRSVPHYIPSLN